MKLLILALIFASNVALPSVSFADGYTSLSSGEREERKQKDYRVLAAAHSSKKVFADQIARDRAEIESCATLGDDYKNSIVTERAKKLMAQCETFEEGA
jgi:hypothetical protein